MGQAGSVQQKCALRDVLVLCRPNVSNTELEEVLRTFCALFPLELQVPVNADSNSITNILDIDIKERRLFDVIYSLLQDQAEHPRGRNMMELTLTTFQRIIHWRELYKLCAKCSLKPFFFCLLQPPASLTLAVLETLQIMLSPCPGFETGDKAANRSETANRKHFGDSGGFDILRSLLVHHGAAIVKDKQEEYRLQVLAGVLSLFYLTLVERRHVTDGGTSMQAVDALMNAQVSLLDLCHCRGGEIKVMCLAIALVKELFFRLDPDKVHELQDSARKHGALLYALDHAVQEDSKQIEDMRDLTADLVEAFCIGNVLSHMTMYRIFPVEMFINRQKALNREKKYGKALHTSTGHTPAAGSGSLNLQPSSYNVERRRHSSIATSTVSVSYENAEHKRNYAVLLADTAANSNADMVTEAHGDARVQWRDIILALRDTHEGPELVWRASMRAELCYGLQAEINTLEGQRKKLADEDYGAHEVKIPCWNYEVFHLEYASMLDELVVNGYFVKYLIPELADSSAAYEIVKPDVFAWHLVDQLAVQKNKQWLCLCIRCLRLVIKRYVPLFHGHIPTQYVQLLLKDHIHHSPTFVRECFLYLYTVITTAQDAPSKSFYELCTNVTRSILSVLGDPALVARFGEILEIKNEADRDNSVYREELEDKAVFVVNERDALIRAGVSLLLAIARRGKFVLRLVIPKRMFLCRLFAVETLDHVTITRLLCLLEQLAFLDGNSACSCLLKPREMPSRLSFASLPTQSSLNSNWRSLSSVFLLLASCDPKGMGMCVAAAEFLQKCCAIYSSSSGGSDTNKSLQALYLNDLLNEANGCGGCGIERLLISTSAEAFADIFNAHETRAADVKWGQKQRMRLHRFLKLNYLELSEVSEANVSSCNVADEIVHQKYEDNDPLVKHIFLRSYIEGGGKFLSKWTPEMYNESISALLEELIQLGRINSAYTTEVGSTGLSALPIQQQSLTFSLQNGNLAAAESWEIQVLILKALVRLVPSHGADVKISTEVYESLLAPLRRSMLSDLDQTRGIWSLELLMAILSMSETRSVNTAACRRFLEKKGLMVLAGALKRMRTPAFQHMLQNDKANRPRQENNPSQTNMARVLLYRATDVLSILASKKAAGIHAIVKNPDVVIALIELTSRQCIMQDVDVDAASVCLSCVCKLCHYDELRTVVLNAGGLLSLVDTVAFCPADEHYDAATAESRNLDESSEADSSDNIDGRQVSANNKMTTESNIDNFEWAPDKIVRRSVEYQRIPSRFFSTIRCAALVLRAFLEPANTPTSSLSCQVLNQLLTPSFVRVLRISPDEFVLKLQTTKDISTATLIWTVSMRQRLYQCIATELAKVKAAAIANIWPRWDPQHFVAADSFRYQYPELTDVLVVHDVYLANFVALNAEELELSDIDMAAFSQALLISIQSHENVLQILNKRGSSDPTKNAAVRLMRQALDKLVQKHPQHNLEVKSSRDVLLADGTRAISPVYSSPNALAATGYYSSPTDDRDWNITQIQRCSSSGIEDLTV
ncbi:Armadillo-type fold [Plasmopara halstedii]|uniref:Armadillo-type fold n=1 Tax=Plasmopara halstedii TaxID=4781 RepID=A0A0P1ADF7_PLAHL|nr:Armadillo-type fold [Plasmopara halstedii]CEG38766.1 Armadillo-type fold [Plasmopara halstedii]|eukprot:XP_024575135.1 Armadillo-type fold [Plasmopara halstedii]